MLFAPPIVSHASNLRTKLLSFNIFFIEKARDKVTANGKPSGIATTTTVKAKMKYSNKCFKSTELFQVLSLAFSMPNLIKSTMRIKIAEISPNFPISSEIFYNLFCNGVGPSSS